MALKQKTYSESLQMMTQITVQTILYKPLKHKSIHVQTSTMRGSPASRCYITEEKHFCHWYKGPIRIDCIRDQSSPRFSVGVGTGRVMRGKDRPRHWISLQGSLWRGTQKPFLYYHFSEITPPLHLPVAKWHHAKRIKKEAIIYEDSLFSWPFSHL